jgi:hypothetical protein
MKALTIRQPYASAIAIQIKKFETRSRRINFRGTIAIHAAAENKKWLERRQVADIVRALEPYPDDAKAFRDLHLDWMDSGLPYGAVIATAEVVDCIETDDDDFLDALPRLEKALGDYSWGRFAWKLENVTQLLQPVTARGQLGLWNWEEGDHG